jgi:hypothetical protein
MKTIINDWALVFGPMDPYKAPEQQTMHLQGVVNNHPSRPDSGKRVRTSPLTGLEGDLYVTQSGTKYALGTVLPEYEAQFPNAEVRLFLALRKRKNTA